MCSKWVGALAGLVASAGLSFAQPPITWAPNPDANRPAVAPPGPPPVSQLADTGHCAPEPGCCPDDRSNVWVTGEYLYWGLKGNHALRDPLLGTIPTGLALGGGDLPQGAIN